MSRVLVIDDSDLVANLLKEALAESGYEVALAGDANQGYAAALEFHPDLILLDVNLPDITGIDLISILKNRQELKEVPIIMITGTHNQTDSKVKALKAGADDYVLKPFEMPELLERVAAVLRRSSRNGNSPQGVPSLNPKPGSPPSKDHSAAPAASPAPTQVLSLYAAIRCLWLEPQNFPVKVQFPPASMAFLIVALTLGFLGLAASSSPSIKPAVYALVLLLSWVTFVSILVMTCSVIGIALTWKEGGRMFSLAASPLLLKSAGGVIASFWTSLSPFCFTAGPALFVKSPSVILDRLDIFELWSLGLLGWLLSLRPASSRKRAGIVCILVWLAALAMAMVAQKLGS